MPKRIVVIGGYAPSLVNFRRPLLQALGRAGCDILACAPEPDTAVADTLAGWGIRYTAVPLARTGLNPLADWTYCRRLRVLLRRERPEVVLAYTHKPVVFSALAMAKLTPRPRCYALITGLGYAFSAADTPKKRLTQVVLRWLYRRASRHFTGVLFQNPDDQALFRELGLVALATPQLVVRGSGIDLEQFAFAPLGNLEKPETLRPESLELENLKLESRKSEKLKPEDLKREGLKSEVMENQNANLDLRTSRVSSPSPQLSRLSSQVSSFQSPLSAPPPPPSAHPTRFLLIARLLADKGIREYAAAARQIRIEFPAAEFQLVGPVDTNPAAISADELSEWQREGVLQYRGPADDVRPALRDCTVYVLPSYREGTPRTVLEAMAISRAVITTDAPGCRETVFDAGPPDGEGVREGRNGFLIPPKSTAGLVAAMRRFIRQPELAVQMGAEGRRLVEEHYDVRKVNRVMLRFMGLGGD